MKADNPDEAIDEFLGVPGLESEKGDWYVVLLLCGFELLMQMSPRGFKGLKQAIKLEFTLRRYESVRIPAKVS